MTKLSSLALSLVAFVSAASFAVPQAGEPAPAFQLTDATGKKYSLRDFAGKTVVLEWFNKDCPFVRKHYDSGNMQSLQKTYGDKGVVWFQIISSKKGSQGHMTAQEAKDLLVKENASPKALLLDEDGVVGKSYGAKTTPHMYVIDPKGLLAYSGAIDDKPSTEASDIPKSKNLVAAALDEVIAGKKVTVPFQKPYGCSVKY